MEIRAIPVTSGGYDVYIDGAETPFKHITDPETEMPSVEEVEDAQTTALYAARAVASRDPKIAKMAEKIIAARKES